MLRISLQHNTYTVSVMSELLTLYLHFAIIIVIMKIKNEQRETMKAGGVIINDDNEILLVTVPDRDIWAYPKGHIEQGETKEEATKREMIEEVGCEVEIVQRLSDIHYTNQETEESIRIHMFLMKIKNQINDGEEGIIKKWFTLPEARLKLAENLKFLIDEVEMALIDLAKRNKEGYMTKEFDVWNIKKQEIHNRSNFSHPKEREIWWCSVGQNIGNETYGKGANFTRPVLIINAEASESFIGIPLSSKIKKGKYRAVIKTEDEKIHDTLIYQVKLFDKRRLSVRIYTLDKVQYIKIKEIFLGLYKV